MFTLNWRTILLAIIAVASAVAIVWGCDQLQVERVVSLSIAAANAILQVISAIFGYKTAAKMADE